MNLPPRGNDSLSDHEFMERHSRAVYDAEMAELLRKREERRRFRGVDGYMRYVRRLWREQVVNA